MSAGLPEIPEQDLLFNPDRFSAATVSVWIRLPASNTRSFAIASALGKSFREGDKSFRPLGKGEIGKAVLIRPQLRNRILRILGVGLRRWEKLVADWESRNVAHRCFDGVVCLFNVALEPGCPNPFCGAVLLVRSDPNGQFAPPELLVRSNVPKPGDALLGMDKGMKGLDALNSSSLEANEGQVSQRDKASQDENVLAGDRQQGEESWCLRCQRYGIAHPGGHVREWTTMRRGAW